jgi:hypothetical protein
MKILASNEYQAPSESTGNVLVLANDVNALEVNLDGITQVDLHFPTSPTAAPSARPICCAAV